MNLRKNIHLTWHAEKLKIKIITLHKSVQYNRGCSVHWGVSLSTLEVIIEYTGGISLSTPGECSVHWVVHTNSIVFPMTFLMISPGVLMISPTILMIPPVYCTLPVYCTYIMQGDHTNCKPGLVTMTLQALLCDLPQNVPLELSNSHGRRQTYILDKNSLKAFIGVETASLTFGTKQYSTSYNSHICCGKRFCNDFFLNHNRVA